MTPQQEHRAPYIRIADLIREEIVSGRIQPGEKIPSLREIERVHGVSNATAQNVHGVLKGEGLIESQIGSGARVKIRRPMIGVSSSYLAPKGGKWITWKAAAARLGMKGDEKLGRVRSVPAPEEVASRLGIAPGERVVLRPRTMLLDDIPVQLVDSYFPMTIAQGTALAGAAKIPQGAPALLAELGHRCAESVEDLIARPPTPDEDRALGEPEGRSGMPDGVPVIRVIRTVFDQGGAPVEVCIMTMNADRHRLEYRLPFHS